MTICQDMHARSIVAGKCIHKWVSEKDRDTDSDATGEETTPTTIASDTESCDATTEGDEELEFVKDSSGEVADAPAVAAPQLGPGLYNDDDDERLRSTHTEGDAAPLVPTRPLPPPPMQTQTSAVDEGSAAASSCDQSAAVAEEVRFSKEQTLFVFDWDDTILPSSWVQRQGLRLDDGASVNQWQRERLSEVAVLAAETLRLAKKHGTVVVVTNAERGWIELSCQKFLPTLYPMLENVRMVSARTSYEGPRSPSPLDWKMCAFEVEIERFYGFAALDDPAQPKNIFSLGDGAHEREALMKTTQSLPNCHAKSLKFVERPDISQIIKQHQLIAGCFDTVLSHEGNLDLCIRCE
mmetsp:Transcript_25070/g.71394  ORF Transcript_25070/g.71394 Transcript_25070/m.71394 type:complete len:352 (-) Transcript_25070:189-1244(-)